jgi:hypothetical protein
MRLRTEIVVSTRRRTAADPESARRLGELRAEDFEAHAVWVQCHTMDGDEFDEEMFRPWDGPLPVNPAAGMFLVRAVLTLADRTESAGFITPQPSTANDNKPDLGLIQPYLFLASGENFGFWYGALEPEAEDIARNYERLGRGPERVFPGRFEAMPDLAMGITSGEILGFYSIDLDRNEVRVHT